MSVMDLSKLKKKEVSWPSSLSEGVKTALDELSKEAIGPHNFQAVMEKIHALSDRDKTEFIMFQIMGLSRKATT